MAQAPVGKNTTEMLIEDYLFAEKQVANAEQELRKLRDKQFNTASELGRRMCPADVKVGEQFSMWVQTDPKTEKMLTVTYVSVGDFKFSWRSSREVV